MNIISEKSENLLAYVSHITAAHITSHKTPLEEIPTVITRVFQTLNAIERNPQGLAKANKAPAVPVNESVFDDYIICLEDGKKLSMLKRHLNTMYGMTLVQYQQFPLSHTSVNLQGFY